MLDVDFLKIRNHDGSQDNGFEELICQLAHLSRPKNADYFVRKEGAGGDAGVECYWKLLDGTEHAWQAKFFTESIKDNQWVQISKSVETALEKHPKITKYYVCLPRDWTDSRKTGVNGKVVNSAWDKWLEHVEKWRALAEVKGMNVEFTYWCKHEISQMLQTDSPEYAGRALYWFNEPVIHHRLLTKIAEKSRESLGERFTSEFHLDLPIAKQLNGLGLTPQWNERLFEQKSNISNLAGSVLKFIERNKLVEVKNCWKELQQSILFLNEKFGDCIIKNKFLENSKYLYTLCLDTIEKLGECRRILHNTNESDDKTEYPQNKSDFSVGISHLSKLNNQLESFRSFLKSKALEAAVSKAAILLGEAGIGKSHLLCDIALKRIDASLPTLFLLGQHYSGGNPLNLILDSLDLKGSSYQQVLGALDSAGEAKKTRTLIIIDAINEGHYRDEWFENISAFLSEISKYQNIAVLLSCRTTYKDYILPDIPEAHLTQLVHVGFKGYEHRAAAKYLSKQGISKPSTPITSPEFSNPLFLKTCCKSLKINGLTSFPKGMNGQSQLFDFYLASATKIINRKKRYRPGEEIVRDALNEFVKFIFPDYLPGLPITKARKIIDKFDPMLHMGDSLTNLLIDEGVLSLDVEPSTKGTPRGTEVIRFTYERFSDYFIAQHILSHYVSKDNIEAVFSEEGLIGSMLKDGSVYQLGGIIEALGICFPEQFGHELIEFIPKEFSNYNWMLERTFINGILWRSPNSFTEESVNLLNQITSNRIGFHNEALDILLALSTEPNHPWNADFLDRNLARMSLPERDAFWSTNIALNDQEEDEGQAESIIRTLIEWSLSVDVRDVELERIRLTSIALIWMTTTSNRKVRNEATKSLARIFSEFPTLISNLIRKYKDCNDLYLVERLYAASYGAVCNINDVTVIKDVAELIYEIVFQDGKPYPHILLRDYARGIIELAYAKGILSSDITPDKFRPPYISEWPVENPTKEEIEQLIEDKSSTSIKNSVLGFPGDFGNYTMGCVRNWSPTILSEQRPESTLEVHRKFANSLPHELKEKYNFYLDKKIEGNNESKFNLKYFLQILEESGVNIWTDENDQVLDSDEELKKIGSLFNKYQEMDMDWNELKEQIEAVQDESDREYFKWIIDLGFHDSPARFNKEHAQRWVCKRAYELGWKSELFEDFERMYINHYGRNQSNIERIGKKYQWIAFHEFLARMSDNVHWIGRGYSDVDDSKFLGPWQIDKRDIDPTVWQRKDKDCISDGQETTAWWQPYKFPFTNGQLEDIKAWLWNRTLVPEFNELLKRTNPQDDIEWLVLRGFTKWDKKPMEDKDVIPAQDGWFRINSCIVKKEDIKKLRDSVTGKNLCDPGILSPVSTGQQVFLKEYPWHPSCEELVDWREAAEDYTGLVSVKHLIPVCEYEWENEDTDNSKEGLHSFYMPSKQIIHSLELANRQGQSGSWIDNATELAFIDPSVKEAGPSYALIRAELIESWLHENDLQLVWLVGGEKQLFTGTAWNLVGRLIFSGIYTLNGNEVEGNMWFIEEPNEDA
ncbi:AVAST type 2 anti-phage system protein Avs2 [Bacillus pretiosus]|uniref:AVAST type 2 anti-phage system protein Avs2 n=1 Tax=Bacillus pretiosus TaxID=2983392 RepID=UPI003D302987